MTYKKLKHYANENVKNKQKQATTAFTTILFMD